MNFNSILISIVISTKGKPWETLSKTLDSILLSDFEDLEVILVDQNTNGEIKSGIGSDDKYKDIIYVASAEKGLSNGRNTGIERSCGKWLIFFDDDAIMPAETLGKAASHLIAHKDEPLIFYGNVNILGSEKPYLKKSFLNSNRISLFNFDSVCSIALIFNRKIFDTVGLFDVNLGAGTTFGAGEETDIILQALRSNCSVRLLGDFKVYHPADVIDLEKRESYGMGIGAIYRKHITSSFRFFTILGPKFFLEMVLRSVLIIIRMASAMSRNYHFYFLKGNIKGFLKYRKDKKT